jgi:myosin light chain 6
LGDVLRALGQNPTEAEVKKSVSCLKEERMSFDVFLPILQTIARNRSTDSAEDFIEGLRHFDKDGSGFISSAELRHLLTTLGEKLSEEEVESLLTSTCSGVEQDSSGNVSYEDFVRLVMSG